jgi:hypothetical protein
MSGEMYHEVFGNIHMHTTYSDGTGTFGDIVDAARRAGLDFVYVTDHNILVREREEGYRRGVLTLVGQEIHDEKRVPERTHLLCLGVREDVSAYASSPQAVVDAVARQGALSFLAHPIEEYTAFLPDHYSWEDWDVTGYSGVELWNYMAGFRGYIPSKLHAILVLYAPQWFMRGPLPAMLQKWDALCAERPTIAIGGTDVHAWSYKIAGPLRRTFLTYVHCANALNTHLLLDRPLNRNRGRPRHDMPADAPEVQEDHAAFIDALARGHCWVGYDIVAPTKGFRFEAWQRPLHQVPSTAEPPDAIMGDTLAPPTEGRATFFRVSAPQKGEIRLLRNGETAAVGKGRTLEYWAAEPGVYRIEVWKRQWAKSRGWIFSNPIYIR